MIICNSCGAQMDDGVKFCGVCGAPIAVGADTTAAEDSSSSPQVPPSAPVASQPQAVPPIAAQAGDGVATISLDLGKDQTSLFSPEDISKNKVFAIAAYLLGFIGIIIALLATRESKFAMFHVRESMKLVVTDSLLLVITMILVWTIIVPIVAAICFFILAIIQIICIVRACQGKAKKAPLVGSLKFLE